MVPKRIITVDGEQFEVNLERDGLDWIVVVKNQKFRIKTDEDTHDSAPSRQRGGKKRKRSGTISSSIPGKVVSLHTSVDEEVKEGDVVMILEAMKMQNEIQAPLSGIVIEINCNPGESVEANFPLIVIEPIEDENN